MEIVDGRMVVEEGRWIGRRDVGESGKVWKDRIEMWPWCVFVAEPKSFHCKCSVRKTEIPKSWLREAFA